MKLIKRSLFAPLLLVCLLGFTQITFAQAPEPDIPEDTLDTEEPKVQQPQIGFKPMIGIGSGMFTFYGDISDNHRGYHPTVSNLGYHVAVRQPLTNYLDFNFYVIHGTVAANERTLDRNLNFRSRITTGGITLGYNFYHILPKEHNVTPYFFTGIESFEFLSKTDMFDAHGNRYNYWSDGSIRNLAEDDPNAASAIEIYRDYTYETDLRELNLDGLGKYPERSWAIPVGVGVNFKLADHWMFKFNTSMHFAMTDLVDNVTAESTGGRAGNANNDRFLYTGFTINYDLHLKDKKELENPFEMDDMDTTLFVYDDSDGDEVFDVIDDCPDTPEGVEVTENGCPVDGDGDGVPDYLDDELNTPIGHVVNNKGVALEDTVYWEAYARFVDSTGRYATFVEERTSTESASLGPRLNPVERPPKKQYFVQVGSESKEITPEMIDYLLSLESVETSIDENGNVVYTIGNYEEVEPAIRMQLGLGEEGIASTIGGREGDRELTPQEIAEAIENSEAGSNGQNGSNDGQTEGKVVFRVQIGAFRNRLSDNVFSGVDDLLTVEGNDGLTRYVTRSYDNLQDAAGRKVDLVIQGFDDAFITAYRDGKRITLAEAGATYVAPDPEDIDSEETPSTFDRSKIKYSVQLGAYQSEVPTDVLDKFIELGNVDAKRQDGVTKYIMGTYDDYEAAKRAMDALGNFPDAFIVAQFNGNVISVEEANKMMEE